MIPKTPPKHRPSKVAEYVAQGIEFKMVPGPAWYARLNGQMGRGRTKVEAAESLLKKLDNP